MKPLARVNEESGCIEWIGSVSKITGYGKKQLNGKSLLAHRWIWEQLFGPIPSGMVVNHKCSNRRCVNPAHLEITSQAGNCRHGGGTKLTEQEAKEIKQMARIRSGKLALELASKYSVSRQLIQDIWSGRAWKEL